MNNHTPQQVKQKPRQERVKRKIQKRIASTIAHDLHQEDKFYLSREQLLGIVKDAIDRYIDKNGLITFQKALKIQNKLQRASDGELFKKDK